MTLSSDELGVKSSNALLLGGSGTSRPKRKAAPVFGFVTEDDDELGARTEAKSIKKRTMKIGSVLIVDNSDDDSESTKDIRAARTRQSFMDSPVNEIVTTRSGYMDDPSDVSDGEFQLDSSPSKSIKTKAKRSKRKSKNYVTVGSIYSIVDESDSAIDEPESNPEKKEWIPDIWSKLLSDLIYESELKSNEKSAVLKFLADVKKDAAGSASNDIDFTGSDMNLVLAADESPITWPSQCPEMDKL